MPAPESLFDLFGDFTASWPVGLVQETPGFSATSPPTPATWLTALNLGVHVASVRTGAVDGRVSVEARLVLDPIPAYPEGWPFVLASMPDVEFRVQPISGLGKFVHLFASVSDAGVEVVLERLPVEIRLPPELVEPHPNPDDHPSGIAEIAVGTFTPGSLDSLRVVYRRGDPTSIFVHVRLRMTEDGEFDLQPAVPVSFGKCLLSALPCLAVHDFRLIPSPEIARDSYEWIRHPVTPWLPQLSGPLDGLFTIRSIHLDPATDPLADLAHWFNRHSSDTEPTAEFVLDDVVVPFWAPYVIPVPRHVTAGVRRRVLDPGDESQVFAFERAPVHADLSRDPAIALNVESLFYKSLPSEDLSEDLGLTFSAALVFGEDESAQNAFEIGLAENYTLLVGYRRDFSTSTGMPAPGTGAEATINSILHWEIAGTVFVDVMALRAGLSFGRKFGEGKSFGDSTEATADLFVSMPPTGGEDSFFRLRSLNGEKVAFAIEGVGWRQGSIHVEGISLPDGVIAIFGPVGIVIQEIGLVADQGASYLSFSAGVLIRIPSGFEGGLSVRRLRFRVAGAETAPPFKLDGFFLFLKLASLYIEAGGYYTDTTVDSTRVREFGLTGSVHFELGAVEYVFGIDLLSGSRKSPAEEFDYFMAQVFFRGSVQIAWFELRGARVLYASNMLPKLSPVDRDSRELRYFNWYKASNPLTVPGDRRLAAWQASRDSWGFGIGVNASFAGLGKAVELGVFVLAVAGPTENGWLVVGELFLFSNTRPVGYFALEWDGKNDRFSLVLGVELKIEHFLKNPPSWSRNVAKLSGTLFVGNDPPTLAIGRLSDERTWLSLRFDVDLWLRTFIQFGACIEYVDRPEGPKGFGLVVRVEGGINAGIVRVTYNAGFGFVVMTFQTGSSDFAAAIFIEAGLRIVLFGFLRFGISAHGDFRVVGTRPSRGEMRLQIRLETPWFLPDVTWTLEVEFGELAPADLATAASPLRSAGATDGATQKSLPLHAERFDPSWNGEGVAPTHSVNELRAPVTAEATRIARFAADTDARPIATDSTVGIEWSVAVNDRLGLGTGIPPGLGDQRSGDLQLTYDLVGIAVRRRARYGSDTSWRPLEERIELDADFTDPSGVQLSGSFAPQELTKLWDVNVQVGGAPAAKKLLVNGAAPFEFATTNPEVDEELVRNNPTWPCCPPPHRKKLWSLLHEVQFREERAGASLDSARLFSASESRLRFLRPALVRPALAGGLPAGALVAGAEAGPPGVVFRAELDEDAAFCFARLAWPRAGLQVVLVALDDAGTIVGRQDLPPGSGSFQVVRVAGQGAIRRLEARVVTKDAGLNGAVMATHVKQPVRGAVEVDWVAYLGLRDYLDVLVDEEACRGGTAGSPDGYEGRGKLFFLPNHEYEITLTTRVTIAHPSRSPESADVEEFLYFRTKGLPGLNVINRVGEEVEPYVASAYAGGRGVLYREEPITLAFRDGFNVAVPLSLRPPGTSEERTTLLRLQLLAQPDAAVTEGTAFTATARDWIVDHRGAVPPLPFRPLIWRSVVSFAETRGSLMTVADPVMERLAALTQRPEVSCGLADPRRGVGTVLVAPPQGEPDPSDPSRELWPASARFMAIVRQEEAGFVDRRPFEAGDETAFAYALQTGPGGSGDWSLADGEIRVGGGNARRFAVFGEPDWDHLTITVGLAPGAPAAGVGVGLPAGGNPGRGMFALVEESSTGRRLAVYRREAGGTFVQVDSATLPDAADPAASISLVVTSFDDRLRASVGETMVEVDRNEFREGRLCLVARGTAAFRSLQVNGLDVYSFPFAVGRYASFEEHVQSFDGVIDEVAPDVLGAGTTASTVAALWGGTQADVQAAMQAASEPAARQALFERWVGELGLPLRDEVDQLELTRLAVAGKAQLLLLESPEPLDFTAEIQVSLTRLAVAAAAPRAGPPAAAGPRVGTARAELDRFERVAGVESPLVTLTEDELVDGRRKPIVIVRVERRAEGLRVELGLAPGVSLRPGTELVFAELQPDGHPAERRVRFYAGTVARVTIGSRLVIDARAVEDRLPLGDPLWRTPPWLDELEPGDIALLSPDLQEIVDIFTPRPADQPIDVRILQDATAKRALVIPVSPTGATELEPGTYRLRFLLERKRWETDDPADDVTMYRREVTLGFSL